MKYILAVMIALMFVVNCDDKKKRKTKLSKSTTPTTTTVVKKKGKCFFNILRYDKIFEMCLRGNDDKVAPFDVVRECAGIAGEQSLYGDLVVNPYKDSLAQCKKVEGWSEK